MRRFTPSAIHFAPERPSSFRRNHCPVSPESALVRGFEKVRGEMALLVHCYNLRRLLSILGIGGFIGACRKRRQAALHGDAFLLLFFLRLRRPRRLRRAGATARSAGGINSQSLRSIQTTWESGLGRVGAAPPPRLGVFQRGIWKMLRPGPAPASCRDFHFPAGRPAGGGASAAVPHGFSRGQTNTYT